MKTSSQNMARSAVSTALTVIVLYLASLVPTGRLALVCAASVGVIFVRMRCGRAWAFGCFAASWLLSLLLLPEKGIALLYGLFLGYYPLIKLESERIPNRILRWGLRLLVFNAAFWLLFVLVRQLFDLWLFSVGGSVVLFALAANAVFVVYDYALTQVFLIYLRKIDGRI